MLIIISFWFLPSALTCHMFLEGLTRHEAEASRGAGEQADGLI